MPSFTKVLINDFFLWVGTRGLKRTLSSAPQYIHHLMIDRLYDWKFGTKTSRYMMLKALNVDRPSFNHSLQCEPTPFYRSEKILKTALQLSGLIPSEVVLVDFGCGTGRILMVGLTLGFSKAIGIESSLTLCQVASQNLRTFTNQYKQSGECEIVAEDASHFEIPSEANILYFFNPFNAQVMESVIKNILTSHRKCPRCIWVIYLNPRHGILFEKQGFVSVGDFKKGCKLYYLK